MRPIAEELSTRIASGVTTLAHVWRVVRRDGEAFAFTDHDQVLLFDALVCAPMSGLVAGAVEKSLGLGVDTASVSGALSADAITEDDLARGVWDGARVDLYRVDWREPGLRVHLFAGRLGEVRRGRNVFEAEWRGLQAALNKPVGRVFSRYCDADLGDARCGKMLETSAWRGDGVVAETLSPAVFRVSGLDDYAADWFSRGRIVWSDGASHEVATHRVEAGGVTLELAEPLAGIELGATFVIYAGCDKRVETCRAKFDNLINFRGFPHMPGNDAVQSRPAAGERLDGGSRHS